MLVGSDGYLCYDTRDPSRWVRPDCVVAFGVDPAAIFARNGYVISEVGKPPDFVLEVASESTGRRDYTRKRELYAEYGVAEYWRFDRSGGEYHDGPLSGDRLANGRYEPLPLDTGADGVIRGYSPVLGLQLHWDAGQLRFYDPAAGDYLPDLAEAKVQRDAVAAEQAAPPGRKRTPPRPAPPPAIRLIESGPPSLAGSPYGPTGSRCGGSTVHSGSARRKASGPKGAYTANSSSSPSPVLTVE